jgi:hypothetical protein
MAQPFGYGIVVPIVAIDFEEAGDFSHGSGTGGGKPRFLRFF